MTEKHFVVVGDGPAGIEAALTLRELSPEARISVIGKGRQPGFAPSLLPDYIAGQVQAEGLCPCADPVRCRQDIKFRCGQKVVGLNIDAHQLIMDHRELISFDGMILAVGSRPRIPEKMQVFGDLLMTLANLTDGRLWRQRLAQVESVLLIGGDLASLAVARALLQLEKRVYFLFTEEAFWPLRCTEAMLAEIGERMRSRGVTVVQGEIHGMSRLSDDSCEIILDGEPFRVGMVGAFFGLVPNVGFLARSGLLLDRGVLVDEYLFTGHEGIYAAGDCAQIYHPEIRNYWISIGHENAKSLGRIAAMNLAGTLLPTAATPSSIFSARGIRVNTSWWTEF